MKMTSQEWKNLFRNKILLISVIAIILIPILYSSIFDKSVWDPYGRAKDLPVAVVNEDSPVDFMGQKIAIGDQVIDNLKSNHELDWHFVSREEADQGMKDLKYYMVVTITKDFSKNAASLINKEPKEMEIIYTTNGSLNYIAEDISQVAASQLEAQVREQVIAAYVEGVLTVGEKAVAGINEAADGSGQLASGVKEYTDGVFEASDGSTQLAAGMAQLVSSINPLVSGVNQLDSGSSQLSSALNKINNGIAPFQNNVSTIDADIRSLANGAKDLSEALATFENSLDPNVKQSLEQEIAIIEQEVNTLLSNQTKLNDISSGAAEVSQKATDVDQALSGASANVTRIDSDINTYLDSVLSATSMTVGEKNSAIAQIQGKVDELIDQQVSDAQAEIDAGLLIIATSANDLAIKAQEVATLSNDISQIADAIALSASSINAGVSSINSAIGPLENAINQVHSGSATNIATGLNMISNQLNTAAKDIPLALSGVSQLANGSAELNQGLNQMKDQMPTLSSGVFQLNDGASQLNSGLLELDANSATLASGAEELASSLESAAEAGETIRVSKKNVNQFAAPTQLTLDEYSKVANYGEALAPYIMSLALFVGCMLFNFVYPIRKISLARQSSGSWWLSKVSLGFGVSSAMALIQASIMLLIGLPVDNIVQFYMTAFITAWAYMSITMFLAMTFDNPGRFMAMVLLVLQLGGAGGTFPIELQSGFFKVIHPFLPMSYSVYAFKEGISGGIGTPLFTQSIFILLALMVIFVLLLRYSMHILQKKHLENTSVLDDNQELQALEN